MKITKAITHYVNFRDKVLISQVLEVGISNTRSRTLFEQAKCCHGKATTFTSNIIFAHRHFSVNACLAPICSMHGLAVTTVEGIGSTKTGLHPVQVSHIYF